MRCVFVLAQGTQATDKKQKVTNKTKKTEAI